MEYRSVVLVTVSSVFVALVAASAPACSSSSSSTTDAGANDSGIVPTEVCAKSADYQSCKQCCNPPVAYFTAQTAFIQCMCNGPCKSPCAATACSGDPDASTQPQSADCSACLDNDPSGKNCQPAAQNVCNQDANCTRFTQCVNDACNPLPLSDAGH